MRLSLIIPIYRTVLPRLPIVASERGDLVVVVGGDVGINAATAGGNHQTGSLAVGIAVTCQSGCVVGIMVSLLPELTPYVWGDLDVANAVIPEGVGPEKVP